MPPRVSRVPPGQSRRRPATMQCSKSLTVIGSPAPSDLSTIGLLPCWPPPKSCDDNDDAAAANHSHATRLPRQFAARFTNRSVCSQRCCASRARARWTSPRAWSRRVPRDPTTRCSVCFRPRLGAWTRGCAVAQFLSLMVRTAGECRAPAGNYCIAETSRAGAKLAMVGWRGLARLEE
jgi:hypothetical protein